MKRSTGFPNQYVSGVVALTTEAALKKMSPEEREQTEKEMQEYDKWLTERQDADMDRRYQLEHPDNSLRG
jgi:hypothetical protein